MTRLLSSLFLLFLTSGGLPALRAEMVTVRPAEYSGGIKNPFMGFRPGFMGTYKPKWKGQGPYPTLFRHYIKWNDIERSEGDGIQRILDFCNTYWAGAAEANVRIIPRLILQWDDTTFYYPSDIPNGDYSSALVKERVRRMIRRLGQAWDKDPRVAWVQTGIIGKWGEQENPVNVRDNNNEWAKLLGEEFQAAFPNKLKVVRNQQYWDKEGYEWGVYWDSFAHTGQYGGSWQDIKNAHARGRWMTEPIEGEVAYDWGSGRSNYSSPGSDPSKAWDVSSTVRTPSFHTFITDTIRQLHCSSLGWVDGYDKNDPTCSEGASRIQEAFGYRFVISEFSCSRTTHQGGTLSLAIKVRNTGSAPILAPVLEEWPLAFTLVDETTRRLVWTQPLVGAANIRDWLPGDNYDWDPVSNPNGTRKYLKPAAEHLISAAVVVPHGIPSGRYLAGITILDPSTQRPGVFFAIRNFFKESQTQPLCRIGIGEDPTGSTELEPALFNDLVSDDARYYLVTDGNLGGVKIQTASTDVSAGAETELSASLNGIVAQSYQWYLDGLPIAGATSATYRLPSVQLFHAGSYSVAVTNPAGYAYNSEPVVLKVSLPAKSNARLLNISTRGFVGPGHKMLTAGFVISEEGPLTLLIRAVGPGLSSFGVPEVLPDPVLTLFRSQIPILGNDNWDETEGAGNTAALGKSVGAFPLAPGSKDAAFIATLQPGLYTVEISGKAAGASAPSEGVALVEVYLVE